jgi:hypothetical protein
MKITRHIKYSDAERSLASAAMASAMNREVLYHGTRYPKLILRTGVLLRAEFGEQKVCLTRSPEVAAYWALMEREDDEKRGAVLVLDRKSLERRYKICTVAAPFWHSTEIFHDEAEEEIWDDVFDIHRHLVGLATQAMRGIHTLPAEWPHQPRLLKQYEKQVENRFLKLCAKRPTRTSKRFSVLANGGTKSG